MGDLKLTSASGSVTLSPENVAGTTTITVPSSTATLLTTDGDGSSLTGYEGTAVASTGEAGGTKFLREDGDGTCSWQAGGSTGIDDNATSTAITIDSSENVGIGTGSPTSPLHVLASSAGQTVAKFESNQAGAVAVEIDADADRDSFLRFQEAGTTRWAFYAQGSSGTNELNLRNQSDTNLIQFKQDGRGLSQFTAKAWANVNQQGTQAVLDSHNISSITDGGVGYTDFSFSNNMANNNYSVSASTIGSSNGDGMIIAALPSGNTNQKITSSFRIRTAYCYNNSASDQDSVCVMVFGD